MNAYDRIAVGYIGENGILANTWYSVDKSGNLIAS